MYCKFVDQFIEAIDACKEGVGQAYRAPLIDHGTDYVRHGLRIELRRSGARSRLIAILLACAAMLQPNTLLADTIPVRHTEGLMHGFLVLRTLEGKAIADGQMTQDARGDRVTAHLIFRFKDGSMYEDTTCRCGAKDVQNEERPDQDLVQTHRRRNVVAWRCQLQH